jgi:hypothetical protein
MAVSLKQVEKYKDLLNHSFASWALLRLMHENGGCYSTFQLKSDIETKFAIGLMCPARISEANLKLREEGIEIIRSAGLHYRMPPKILDAYGYIFRGLEMLSEASNEKKIQEADKLKRKGN